LGFENDAAILAVGRGADVSEETQKSNLAHIRPPKKHVVEDHPGGSIHPVTEVWKSIARSDQAAPKAILLARDRPHQKAAMGGRLRQWLRFPLCGYRAYSGTAKAIATLLNPERIAGHRRSHCENCAISSA
jgi:hypothetical protein